MIEERPTLSPDEDTDLLRGEVIAVEESQIRVRLESGRVGYAKASGDGIQVGQQATFRLLEDAANHLSIVFVESQASLGAVGLSRGSDVDDSLERDIAELHRALTGRHSPSTSRSAERVHLDEEQIEDWIKQVDARIERLRKSRARRLDEQFYNET